MRTVLLAGCVIATLVAGGAAASTLESTIRTTVETFVSAQNAHDLKAVEGLLSDSPETLWITRGTAVWGRAEALARFQSLYAGTWHLEPDWAAFRLVVALPQVAEVFVPIEFSIGAPDQPAQQTRFLMNMVLTKSYQGWRIASILPIPAAAAPK
jgi:ketosteroid isomerase-like protein